MTVGDESSGETQTQTPPRSNSRTRNPAELLGEQEHHTCTHEEQMNDNGDDDGDDQRRGTLTSARFNILSTMVGGGSLSLPLAFHEAGNSLLAPILLIAIGALVKASVHLLIDAALMSQSQQSAHSIRDQNRKGTASFEGTACEAFGPKAKYLAMSLIATICYLTLVGYGVLLRDMLLPLSDYIFGNEDASSSSETSGPTFHHNITMLVVVLLVTPLCTMRDLTPLEKIGALSMMSISVVACCISYRSLQCNFSPAYDDIRLTEWYHYINLWPTSIHHLWNAIPVLISVFMCHFNVLPVHNELQNPSPQRVNALFTSSIGGACLFYLLVGFAGSMYGNCTRSGQVEGNVLLSFDEDDVLLLVGRSCLSLTITFAFPILVVPCRDILMRAWNENERLEDDDGMVVDGGGLEAGSNQHGQEEVTDIIGMDDNNLAEPLLPRESYNDNNDDGSDSPNHHHRIHENSHHKSHIDIGESGRRRIFSIIIFWSAAAFACVVKSIDIVWDVLGGSLSLFMGFLIPSAAYSVLWKRNIKSHQSRDQGEETAENEEEGGQLQSAEERQGQDMDDSLLREKESRTSLTQAYFFMAVFGPMVFILTGNAIYNIRNE